MPIKLGHIGTNGQGERFYSVKGSAISISSTCGGKFGSTGGYLVDGKMRKLHPREVARLMGYPDSYEFVYSDYQTNRQLGNSTVVDVMQYICLSVADALGL